MQTSCITSEKHPLQTRKCKCETDVLVGWHGNKLAGRYPIPIYTIIHVAALKRWQTPKIVVNSPVTFQQTTDGHTIAANIHLSKHEDLTQCCFNAGPQTIYWVKSSCLLGLHNIHSEKSALIQTDQRCNNAGPTSAGRWSITVRV